MKTLDRYIYRELVVPFLIGTIAVVLMFQANMLIYLFKNFSLSNVPTLAVLDMILYKTPYFLNMTLPHKSLKLCWAAHAAYLRNRTDAGQL